MASGRSIILNIIGNDRVTRTMRNVSRELGNASDETSKLSKAMGGLEKVGKVGGLATAAAGALALAKAAAPAVAVVAAMPAAMAAAKVASGTLQLGMIGVGDAMSAVANGDAKALDEALKKLAPTAKAFVKQAQGMRKEVLGLQQAVQNRLFAGLDVDLRRMGANLLPTARDGMVGVAGALNGIGHEAAKTASTPWFRGQVSKVFQQTTSVLTTLQGAVRPVMETVLRLVVAGGPLINTFAQWAVQGIKVGAAWFAVQVQSGRVATVIQQILGVLARLGVIGANVIRTIANIAGQTRAMGDAGGNFLTTLDQMTAKMAAWSASAQGQQASANLFRTLGQSAQQLATTLPLLLSPLGLIVKAVASLPPPLQNVVGKMIGWSVIIGVVANRLKLLTVITVTHTAVTKGATGAIAAYQAVAGAAGLGGFIAGLRNMNIAMAANATVAQRLGAAIRAQILLYRQQAAAAGVSTARIILQAAAQRAVAVATGIWTGVQWALNAALNANPIGLIVLAIAALVGAVILAWKNSETFRTVVLGAWNALKTGVMAVINFIVPFVRDHWRLIVAFLLGPLGPAFFIISTFWKQIWSAIQTTWNAIHPILNAIVGFLRGAFSIAWIVIQNTIKIVWIAIQIYIKVAVFAIRAYFNLVKAYITQVLAPTFRWLYSNVVKPVWALIKTAIATNWAAIKIVFNAIKAFLSATLGPAFRAFKTVASAAWSGLKSALSSVYSGGIKPVFDHLKSALNTVKSAFGTAVSTIKTHWDKLKGIAKAPVNFVIGVYNKGIVSLVNKLASFAGVKTRLTNIPTLARGGTLDNPMPVGPMKTNGPMAIVGEGRPQYPEYVIPTDPKFRSRAQGLWAAAGRDLGGSPNKWLTGSQQLGGEGLAFARGGILPVQKLAFGGIVGDFVKGIKNFTIGNVEKAAGSVLNKVLGGNVPGSGVFRDMVAAVPKWIKDTVLGWIKKKVSSGGIIGGGGFARALAWAKSQAGKPYVWGGVGPGGYDCSGFMSAITNVIHGKSPYSRLFSTRSFGASGGPGGFKRNARSAFMVGVTNAGVGHMAGTLNGVNVESSGSRGVHYGPGARGYNNSLFGYRYGLKADTGALLLNPGWNPPVYNGTGAPEYLETPRADGAREVHVHFPPGAIVVNEKADVDMLLNALEFRLRAAAL